MGNMLSPLIPAIVTCCHQLLVAVQLPDGRIAVTLQSLCEALQLDRTGQLKRIRRDESLARRLLLVPILTNGGVQKMDVLVASAIPRWLEGVQVSRLAPAKRPLARALQREVEEALNRHFSRTEAAPFPPPQREQIGTSSDSPAQMIAEVAQTMGETAQMIAGAVQMMGEVAQRIVGAVQTMGEATQQLAAEHQAAKDQLTALEGRQAASDEAQQAMGGRLTALEGQREVLEERQQAMGEHLIETREQQEVLQEWQQALGDYAVETRERVTALEQQKRAAPDNSAGDAAPPDSPLLSPQHLAQLFALAREARRQRSTPVSAQLAALAEALGVEDVSDLPQSAWEEVLTWFWQQRLR